MDMAELGHPVALRALGHRKVPHPDSRKMRVGYPRSFGSPVHLLDGVQGGLQGTARVARLAEGFNAAQDVLDPDPPQHAQPHVQVGRASRRTSDHFFGSRLSAWSTVVFERQF